MFSTRDVEKSKIFKSISLINTVTCVKFIGRFLLAGIGNILLIYDTDSKKLYGSRKIFEKATIHGIQFNAKESLVALHGENYVAIYKFDIQIGFLIEFDCLLITTDWVCDVLWMNSKLLLTISAHNVATVWNCDLNKKINSSSCDEQCILYSATSIGENEEDIIVFSGTVFREIVIWSPFRRSNGSNILHRLQKHEGVIFSITVNNYNSVISSTSDDRSVVIWNVEPIAEHQNMYDHWKYAKITPKFSLYAHKARVWKSFVMQSGNILSAGEDGQICLKTSSSTYQWEESRGSQVRSLDCLENYNLVASGCTTGSVGLWSLDSVPKNEIITDYKTNNRYPKHLVVFSNTGTYVLYSDGLVVLYKDNISCDVYQNNVLCCTLTMAKSPCETKVIFTTSSGHIVILKIISDKRVQVFVDKISPVKILSSSWLNNNKLIVSCEGNTVYLYEAIEDCELNQLDSFCITSKTNSWINVAVMIDHLIFAGCNEGSIYLFKLNYQEPLQIFSKIHSFAGVTAMWVHDKFSNSIVVSSVGRDGHHRYWNISTELETVFEIRCEMLPTKWPFAITNSSVHGLLICGFKENNLIVYSSKEQRILATVFCGGGHRAWDLTFVNECESIYFVCSSSSSKLESKKIPLKGQHMLLKGFHSMIVNCMAQVNDDIMMTGSDDTTVRLTRFNEDVDNFLTLRSHISSVRSISCLNLSHNLYIIVTAGGRAQLKIWTLNITDSGVYCEELVSHLLITKLEKRPWRSVVPSNEGETRFMDVCMQFTKTKSILISIGCSDAILRLYNFDANTKTLSLIEESFDCNNCILKILQVQLNLFHYVLATDTKGYVHFWDISKYIENNEVESSCTPKLKHRFHQSGINCCDWFELKHFNSILATGGDDQCLNVSLFHYKDTVTLLCNVSISVHCSQVTGIKLFDEYVISASVDQKIIFSSWKCDLNSRTIQLSPLATYFTTVADIHGLIALKVGDAIKVIVYGQGTETFCANMSSLTPQVTVEHVTPALELGEGPHWDPSTQSLYFVDLHQGKINRYHPETNCYYSAQIEGYDDVTLIIPVQGKTDSFVVGLGSSIGIVSWDGISETTGKPEYVKLIDETPGNRLNDGKADATGRLWVGSMGSEIKENPGQYYKGLGSLYSVELDGSITKRLSNVSISNGMAWSMDNKEFYFVDTYSYAVQASDFDLSSGDLTNSRVIFDLTAKNITGDPDGMTIDCDGNLWLACFNSNHLLKIDPSTGTLLLTVEFPAYQVSSAAFGGPKLDELYVTTAGYQLTDEQKSELPYSGALFRVTNTGSTGLPGVSVKIHTCPDDPLNSL